MSPEKREELLAAHALGALPGPEAAEVEALVRRDPGAAEQLAVYREIADLLGVETPLRAVDSALLERMLRSARRIQQSKRRRFPALRAAAMGVSLIVVAMLGGLVGARLGGSDADPVVVPELNGGLASESGRSHYAEDDPAIFAILEQIAASVWHNRAVDDGREWVWP